MVGGPRWKPVGDTVFNPVIVRFTEKWRETDGNSALSSWFPCRRVARRANDKLLSGGGLPQGPWHRSNAHPRPNKISYSPIVDPTFCKLKAGQFEQRRPGQACHCDGLPFWTAAQCYDALDMAPRGQGAVLEGMLRQHVSERAMPRFFKAVRHSTQRSNQMTAWSLFTI